MREVLLSTGDSVVLYDTSGPLVDGDDVVVCRNGAPTSHER